MDFYPSAAECVEDDHPMDRLFVGRVQREGLPESPDSCEYWSKLSKYSSLELRSLIMSHYRVGSYAELVAGTIARSLPQPSSISMRTDLIDNFFVITMFEVFYGPSGAGKSSFINSLSRIIEGTLYPWS